MKNSFFCLNTCIWIELGVEAQNSVLDIITDPESSFKLVKVKIPK
jgi:hypothetical protein